MVWAGLYLHKVTLEAEDCWEAPVISWGREAEVLVGAQDGGSVEGTGVSSHLPLTVGEALHMVAKQVCRILQSKGADLRDAVSEGVLGSSL